MRGRSIAQRVRGHVPEPARAAYRRAKRFSERAHTPPDQGSAPSRLSSAAKRAGLKLNKPNRAFLIELDGCLRRRDHPGVAVLVGSLPSLVAQVVTEACPSARVFRYDVAMGDSDLHVNMAANGPFDVVVDDTRRNSGRAELLRSVFFHVKPGGAFIVKNLRADSKNRNANETISQLVSRLVEIKGVKAAAVAGQNEQDEQKLSTAIGRLVLHAQHLLLTNTVSARAKIREEEIDTLLQLRGVSSGRLLESRPAVRFRSRCALTESESEHSSRMPKTYRVPAVSLREYHDVVCTPGQVVTQGNVLLPDTYRHNQRKRLKNVHAEELALRFAKPVRDDPPVEYLNGAYFYLDSEFRGHFGHAMTEQLSRLWAWPDAKRAEPGLKALLALNEGRELAEFEIALYTAAGIDPKDLVFVRGSVKVETLLAATPMLSQPDYVHPEIGETWTKAGQALASLAPAREYPRRIFCSRRTNKRSCRNTAEVESLFSSHGFEIIYTEDFSLAEQAMIFRQAEVVGGFAGSALFNLCFSESPKRVVMISSESYTARNEYMIASVLGHKIDLVWCKPDVPMPQKVWNRRAFHSKFAFDFDREGVHLKGILSAL